VVWLGVAVIMLAGAIIDFVADQPWWAILCVVILIIFLAGGLLYLHASHRGKFVVWESLLDQIPADEVKTAVDLGCGRGAVLIATARHFPSAQVTGVDLWRSIDQSGNDPARTRANAEANGVADHIELITADLQDLPLPEASADLVVSSLAIHNIPTAQGRAKAVRGAWHILRPGGRLIIVDLPKIREYAPVLRELGAQLDDPAGLGWRMWWSGPWMPTQVLHATKPSSS